MNCGKSGKEGLITGGLLSMLLIKQNKTIICTNNYRSLYSYHYEVIAGILLKYHIPHLSW